MCLNWRLKGPSLPGVQIQEDCPKKYIIITFTKNHHLMIIYRYCYNFFLFRLFCLNYLFYLAVIGFIITSEVIALIRSKF